MARAGPWATLLLLGCTQGPTPPVLRAPAPALRAHAPERAPVRLALLEPSDVWNMAALEGYLLVEGKCLYIGTRDGQGPRTAPAFLISDIWWDAERNLLLVGDRSIAPGDPVLLSGSSAGEGPELSWVQKPDPSCDASGIFVTGAIEVRPPLRTD